MDRAFRDLIEFHRLHGDTLASGPPATPTDGEVILRQDLIAEEYRELQNAIGLDDLPGIADGCADLIYVVIGTALRYGIDLPAVWDEVHRANVSKFGPGSWVREDGKRMKPPGFKPPDVAGILARQLPLSETYGREDQ